MFNYPIEAAYFIWAACLFDFLDGFVARLLNVSSPIGQAIRFAGAMWLALAYCLLWPCYQWIDSSADAVLDALRCFFDRCFLSLTAGKIQY
ncbi:MAG: CDP-alcohol phosphatidyltransferase family protein [Cytophagales bacterium]|nr:CDP-alcohol phosphatidyltransferase family protein [Cytophagales bacterium]